MSQAFAVTTADMLALVQHMAPEARAELDSIPWPVIRRSEFQQNAAQHRRPL